MFIRAFVTVILAATLAGCGIFGGKNKDQAGADPPIDANRPATKELLKSLPEGLIGDTQNARYSNEELKGDGGKS